MVGGMLGSMLFGGRGYAGGGGGWGGGGGFGIGDFLFLIIILAVIYFVWKHFRNKRAMQYSGTGGETFGTTYAQGYSEPLPGSASVPPPARSDNVYDGLRYISQSDPSFDEVRFKENVEDMFFKIQSAWTKRDLSPVRQLLTGQMLTTFQEDVNRYAANKQFNRLENIAVRQVEIVDAVQDQGEEFITVKFLASLLDYVVDETTNQTISGSTTDPVKFLEYWTFTRRVGDRSWTLAGISQEGDY
jgi:predicted lipid-binding transport protein (Tim44 family)